MLALLLFLAATASAQEVPSAAEISAAECVLATLGTDLSPDDECAVEDLEGPGDGFTLNDDLYDAVMALPDEIDLDNLSQLQAVLDLANSAPTAPNLDFVGSGWSQEVHDLWAAEGRVSAAVDALNDCLNRPTCSLEELDRLMWNVNNEMVLYRIEVADLWICISRGKMGDIGDVPG